MRVAREEFPHVFRGYGDCENYVLLKRRLLIQSGWPREVLLVTVVRDEKDVCAEPARPNKRNTNGPTRCGEFLLDASLVSIITSKRLHRARPVRLVARG